MNLDINKSMVYDTIKFFDIHFNYNKFRQNMLYDNLNTYKGFKFYNIIKEKIDVKNNVNAFFSFEKNKMSMIDTVIYNNVDVLDNIDKLKALILNKNLMIKSIITHYFDKEISYNAITDDDIFQLENVGKNAMLSLGLIVTDYEKIVENLNKQIESVYSKVKLIYSNNNRIIKSFKTDDLYLQTLQEVHKIKIDNNSNYIISLLSPYSINFSYYQKINMHIGFLGYMSNIILEKENELYRVNYESVATLFSNKILINILDIIYEHDKISPVDILKLLPYNLSHATGYRLINNLSTEKAIKIVDRVGKNIYYSINDDYFTKALRVSTEAINCYCKLKEMDKDI